jgi:hypothetical protein
MKWMMRVGLVVLLLMSALGCHSSLPEPESSAAQLYQQRCSGCHRLYAPGIMSADMWTFMVTRMEREFQRRGIPPLRSDEKQIILDYLQKHSNGASGAVSVQRSASTRTE